MFGRDACTLLVQLLIPKNTGGYKRLLTLGAL